MLKILIIDESKDELNDLGKIIYKAFPGSYVCTSLNGSQGMQLAIDKNPDVILLNASLPDKDAFEFCHQFKQDQRINFIPIVFLLRAADKEWKLKALDAGAEGFLIHPVDPVDLVAQVKMMSKIKNGNTNRHDKTVQLNELKLENQYFTTSPETLKSSEHLFHIVAESTYDWEYLIDQNRHFLYCSPSCERITGYKSEQFMADSELLNSIIHPDDQTKYSNHVQEVHTIFQPGELNFRIVRADGTLRWIGHVCRPVVDNSGTLLAIRGSNRDITDQIANEELLKNSEDKYRSIFENVQDVYYEASLDGILLEISPSVEMMTRGKYKREDFIGQTIKDLFIDIKERDALREALFEQGSISDFEISVRLNDGKVIPCTVSSKVWLDEQGKPIKIIGSIRDITYRKQTEETLKQSEESYRNLFENNPQPMFLYDCESLSFVKVNNAAVQFYGYSKDEFLSMTVFDIRPAEDFVRFMEHNSKNNPTYNASGEWRHRKKNGEIVTVDIISHALTFNNRPARYVLINDVTERNRAKQMLLKSEEKFRAIFENNSAVKLLINPANGRIVDANIAAADYYGWTCPELKVMKIQEINTLSNELTMAEIRKISSPDQYRFEFRHRHKDGSVTDVEVFSSKVKIEGVNYLHSIIHDISDRKKAEKALRDQEESYRSLFQSNPHPMWVYNLKTLQFMAVNNAAIQHYGYSAEEFYGMTISDIRPQEEVERLLINIGNVTTGLDEAGIWRHRKKNGQLIWVEIVSHTIDWFNEKAEIVLVNDVTERINAEHDLRVSEDRFRKVVECSPNGIAIYQEGKFVYVNPAGLKMFGAVNQDQMIGKEITSVFHDESADRLALTMEMVAKGEAVSPVDERLVRLDGHPFYAEIAAFATTNNNKPAGQVIIRNITDRKKAERQIAHFHDLMQYVIEHNSSAIAIHDKDLKYIYVSQRYLEDFNIKGNIIGKHHYEVFPDLPQKWRDVHQKALAGEVCHADDDPYIHEDGTIDWTRWECRPWYSADGSIGGIIVYTEIINDRKRVEADLIAAKEKAEESDRLKSAFLANMSHEIRTPLNSIIGFSELLNDSSYDDDKKVEFINLIVKNGHNLLSIINDILDISKIEAGEIIIKKQQLQVNDFLREIVKEYAMKYKHKEVEFHFAAPNAIKDIAVYCDPERLSQVINNLLSNAIKFTAKGHIDVSYQVTDQVARFQVNDTGIGIAPEFHQKIFERFLQVESAHSRKYGGNGLGLAISRKLIELMGGEIWVESQIGIGSVFYFTLPIADIT